MLIAATRGAQNTGVMVNGKQVRVMLIAYIALDSVKKNPDTKAGAKGSKTPGSRRKADAEGPDDGDDDDDGDDE